MEDLSGSYYKRRKTKDSEYYIPLPKLQQIPISYFKTPKPKVERVVRVVNAEKGLPSTDASIREYGKHLVKSKSSSDESEKRKKWLTKLLSGDDSEDEEDEEDEKKDKDKEKKTKEKPIVRKPVIIETEDESDDDDDDDGDFKDATDEDTTTVVAKTSELPGGEGKKVEVTTTEGETIAETIVPPDMTIEEAATEALTNGETEEPKTSTSTTTVVATKTEFPGTSNSSLNVTTAEGEQVTQAVIPSKTPIEKAVKQVLEAKGKPPATWTDGHEAFIFDIDNIPDKFQSLYCSDCLAYSIKKGEQYGSSTYQDARLPTLRSSPALVKAFIYTMLANGFNSIANSPSKRGEYPHDKRKAANAELKIPYQSENYQGIYTSLVLGLQKCNFSGTKLFEVLYNKSYSSSRLPGGTILPKKEKGVNVSCEDFVINLMNVLSSVPNETDNNISPLLNVFVKLSDFGEEDRSGNWYSAPPDSRNAKPRLYFYTTTGYGYKKQKTRKRFSF